MTASSIEEKVDLTGVVICSYTPWIWIWELVLADYSLELDLGIGPWIWIWELVPYALSKHFLFLGGAAGNSAQNAYPRCSHWCCCKNTHPYKSSNNKIPSKRQPFLRPELAKWPPTVLLCTTTGFKKRHLLRCNNVEVGSQVLDVSNLSKTWCEHPVLSRVVLKKLPGSF